MNRYPGQFARPWCCLLVLVVCSGTAYSQAWVERGQLRISGKDGFPHWVRTDREYVNLRLRFDYRLDEWAEAAVYLRAPRDGRPGRSGLAIVLAHDFHGHRNAYTTGAVRGVLPATQKVAGDWGVWHTVEIELADEKLAVHIDKKLVQDVRLDSHPELRYRLKRGFAGFPDLGYGYSIRNLHLEELDGGPEYVDLFNGRDLDGWTLRGGAEWVVRDGVLRAFNGHGIHYAPGEFTDFEFTALVRSHQQTNGGVFFRGGPEGHRGFEIQLYSPPNAVYPTGSIYNLVRSEIDGGYEGRWFLLQVLVTGRRCIVRLDGRTVAETDALPESLPRRGRIGLQMHSDVGSIEFRDIRVRPFGAEMNQ